MFKMLPGAVLPAIIAAIALVSIIVGGPPTVKLDANPGSALPVPKNFSMSTIVSNVSARSKAYRRQLDATIPADLRSVLAFYRSELTKLGWEESSEDAVVKFDSVQLAFATPDGFAALKLGRNKGQTIVDLAQKIPAVAAAANILPNPGRSLLLLSNFGDAEATLTIDGQTVRVEPGEDGMMSPSPTLELPPGKYQYSLEIARVTRNDTIELTADDAWKLSISSNGKVMPQQIY
jgi:hypothetical protein